MKNTNNIETPKWYIVVALNHHEDKVKHTIEQMRIASKLEDFILDVKIVKQSEIDSHTKKETAKNIYPGYIFIYAVMTDEVWYKIRNIKGVMSFIGATGHHTKPTPLKDEEASKMMNKINTNNNRKAQYIPSFTIGDLVTVTKGNWENNSGIVKKLDNVLGMANVDIELFGRLIPVEIEYSHLIKK